MRFVPVKSAEQQSVLMLHRPPLLINTVNLKDLLREVQTDRTHLQGGRLLMILMTGATTWTTVQPTRPRAVPRQWSPSVRRPAGALPAP